MTRCTATAGKSFLAGDDMKVLVVGAKGMLGSELLSVFQKHTDGYEVSGLDLPEVDITKPDSCRTAVVDLHPDVVINAAAFVRVDDCETQHEAAFGVNAEGAGNLAKAAAASGAFLIHYSTDYIFNGQKMDGYLEDDAPDPRSAYGESKLLGEILVRHHCPDHMIIRISWLFGNNGPNFIRTIVEAARKGNPLRVVNDQRGSPTYARDVAVQTLKMVDAGCRGTYHVTNAGACSWYDLAVRAVAWAGISNVTATPVASSEYKRPAPRPACSILVDTRLVKEGLSRMRPWQEAACEYVRQYLA